MKKIATFIVGLFSCCATISANPTETDGFIYSNTSVKIYRNIEIRKILINHYKH